MSSNIRSGSEPDARGLVTMDAIRLLGSADASVEISRGLRMRSAETVLVRCQDEAEAQSISDRLEPELRPMVQFLWLVE